MEGDTQGYLKRNREDGLFRIPQISYFCTRYKEIAMIIVRSSEIETKKSFIFKKKLDLLGRGVIFMEWSQIENYYIKKKLLKTITIELINQCNWKCKHCYLDKEKMTMPKEKIFEIIDDAKNLGAIEVKFSGGEITLRKDLPDIIKYTREKYMDVILLTNLYILTNELESCIEKYGVKRIEVTLFSLTEQVHDNFVGIKGALKKSFSNIKRLKKLGVEILVKTWAFKSNFEELEKMNIFFKKEGIDFNIHVQIYADINGNFKMLVELQLDNNEMKKALYLSDKSLNRKFPLSNCSEENLCIEFNNSIYVTAYGDIVPCAKYRKAISNIYNQNLYDFWEHSIEWHKIQNYLWKDVIDCKDCAQKHFCVRCGAMSYILGHDFLENCTETCRLAQLRMSSNYELYEEEKNEKGKFFNTYIMAKNS